MTILFISLFLFSCNGTDAQKEASEREVKKEQALFELLEKEWRFTFPTASPKVNLTLNEWNEWQQFKNELSQKPKTSLSAYKLKIANVSKKSDSLQFYVPEVYKVPALTSRLLTLDTQLKNLDMYLQLKEVPIKKIIPFLKQINTEIKGLYSQFEELEVLKNIPLEAREKQMLEAIDTTRNADSNSMMERMKNDELKNKKEFDSIKDSRIFNRKRTLNR